MDLHTLEWLRILAYCVMGVSAIIGVCLVILMFKAVYAINPVYKVKVPQEWVEKPKAPLPKPKQELDEFTAYRRKRMEKG